MGGAHSTHKSILVRKPEGMGPLGRTRHRWENSIETLL
jgi:hypothetical protein